MSTVTLPILGITMASVVRTTTKMREGSWREATNDAIEFTAVDGRKWRMWHHQDCCECVSIDDICGNLDDLVGSPIVLAEETSGQRDIDGGIETWTFYRIGTASGMVTIRWLGESNGYYSESVDFDEVKP